MKLSVMTFSQMISLHEWSTHRALNFTINWLVIFFIYLFELWAALVSLQWATFYTQQIFPNQVSCLFNELSNQIWLLNYVYSNWFICWSKRSMAHNFSCQISIFYTKLNFISTWRLFPNSRQPFWIGKWMPLWI